MALQVFHAVVNEHDTARTATFKASLPEGFEVHCFHTDRDCVECQKHINGTDGFPPVSTEPAIMVRVPQYSVPDHVVDFIDPETNEPAQQTIQGWVVPEHYEFISNLVDYNHFLELKQQFENNIDASNAGTYIPDVNPHAQY